MRPELKGCLSALAVTAAASLILLAVVAVAEANYTAAAFQSWTNAQTLALAEIWYIPDAAKPHAGHAIVAALTERGLVFLEPQTGDEVQLTPAQRRSIYLCKW